MGTIGDSIQQNYDILRQTIDKKKATNATEGEVNGKEAIKEVDKFSFQRSFHMTAAGLTTGVATHQWYILLDRYLGTKRSPKILAMKILVDQIIFSPINLFGMLNICIFV